MQGFGNLLDGYRRFRANRFETARGRWQELAEGQAPRAVVIACSDSRADPATIFDTNPGEIFVVRNVANLVPPFETGGGRHGVSAALEFAVTQLNIPEIIIMGHERCGGISAALTGQFHGAPAGEGGFVHKWMSQIDEPAARISREYGTDEDAHRRWRRLPSARAWPTSAASPLSPSVRKMAPSRYWGAISPSVTVNFGFSTKPTIVSVPSKES